jgi:hypothetical protein
LANAVRTWQTVGSDEKLSKTDKNARELGSGLRGAGDLRASSARPTR